MNEPAEDAEAYRDEFNLQEAFEFARATVQSLILINGGAAAAIIAFYGQTLAGKGPSALVRAAMVDGLTCFVIGIVMAVATLISGYVAQMLWGGYQPTTTARGRAEKLAEWATAIAVLFALFSLFAFIAGCWAARAAIAG